MTHQYEFIKQGRCGKAKVDGGSSEPQHTSDVSHHISLNQCCFMEASNSFVMAKPDAEPMTESIPQYGHRAVS